MPFIDVYDCFYLFAIVFISISIAVIYKINRYEKRKGIRKAGVAIAGLILGVFLQSTFYGVIYILFQTPTSVENLGKHIFTATSYDSFNYKGELYNQVIYSMKIGDRWHSFPEYYDSKEQAEAIAKEKGTLERQIFIDSTGSIQYVDKDLSISSYLKTEQKWIYFWSIFEFVLIASFVIIEVLVLRRKRNDVTVE